MQISDVATTTTSAGSLRNAVNKAVGPPRLVLILVASRCVHAFITGVAGSMVLVPEAWDHGGQGGKTLGDGHSGYVRLEPGAG